MKKIIENSPRLFKKIESNRDRRIGFGSKINFLQSKVFHSLKYVSAACVLTVPGTAHASVLSMSEFTDLAQRCGPTVAVLTLAAIAKTESGFETLAALDNTTRKSRRFRSFEEAVSVVERLVASGHSVDMGLMQINSVNLKWLGLTVRDAFDPCKSIAGGASILTGNYLRARDAPNQQVALRDALSAYNTGSRKRGYRNGYVQKVERAAAALSMSVAQTMAGQGLGSESPAPADVSEPSSEWWNVWNQK